MDERTRFYEVADGAEASRRDQLAGFGALRIIVDDPLLNPSHLGLGKVGYILATHNIPAYDSGAIPGSVHISILGVWQVGSLERVSTDNSQIANLDDLPLIR